MAECALLVGFALLVGVAAVFGPDTRDTRYYLVASMWRRDSAQAVPQECDAGGSPARTVSSGCARTGADTGVPTAAATVDMPLF